MKILIAGLTLSLLYLVSPSFAEEAKSGPQGKSTSVQVPAVQQPSSGAQEPAITEETKPEEEVYTYESSRRRDPFYSLISAAKAAEKKRKKGTSPVEEFEVFQFKLMAIILEMNKYGHALVKLPSGKYFILRVGTKVGLHNGKVVRIRQDSMDVEEIATDVRGKQYLKSITLKLRQEEE